MKFMDFEYDNVRLSDLGFMVCDFNGGVTVDDVTNGSQLEFNTVTSQRGAREGLITSNYKQAADFTFQICKKSCDTDIEVITVEEMREIYSWLNREEFHKFKPLNDINGEYINIYFEGSFNVGVIEIDSKIYGFELTFTSNRPFAMIEPVTVVINATANRRYSMVDISDKEGYSYPDKVEITILEDGDLTITNTIEDRDTVIEGCVTNEIITMKYPVISSSVSSHKIQNDFNWNFIRIANTFKNKKNVFISSLNCKIKITYTPVAKVVL